MHALSAAPEKKAAVVAPTLLKTFPRLLTL
jgi:hypothetical protein